MAQEAHFPHWASIQGNLPLDHLAACLYVSTSALQGKPIFSSKNLVFEAGS